MKRILVALGLMLASFFACATDWYVCNCDSPGSADMAAYPACVNGATGQTGASMAPGATGPKQLASDFKTLATSKPAGDRILMCRGGYWSTWAGPGGWTVTNATSKTNPVVWGAYTPTWMAAGETNTSTSTGVNTLTRAGAGWTVNAFAGMEVTIDRGMGVIEREKIASNTATTLTLYRNWRRGDPEDVIAYTIEGPLPIIKDSRATAQFAYLVGSGVGPSYTHARGLTIRDMRIVGGEATVTVDSATSVLTAGVATVTVNKVAHGLTTGENISIFNSTPQGCDTANSVTVVNADQFTIRQSRSDATCVTGAVTGQQYIKMSPLYALFVSNEVWNILIENVTFERWGLAWYCSGGFTTEASSAGTTVDGVVRNGSSNFMTIRKSRFYDNVNPVLGGCGYQLFESNFFDHNAVTLFDHHLYLSDGLHDSALYPVYGHAYESKQLVVRMNTFSNGNIGTAGRCKSAVVVAHGDKDNLQFENNIVVEDTPVTSGGCQGVAVGPAYGPISYSAEAFDRVVVRNNVFNNFGYQSVLLWGCVDCIVENNYIYSASTSSPGGIYIGSAGNVSFEADDQHGNHNIVRNNSIYFSSPTLNSVGIRFYRSVPDGAQSLHEMTGNSVYFGTGVTTASTCFEMGANYSTSEFTTWDYNHCYAAGGVVPLWIKGQGAQNYAAAQLLGLDTHSLAPNTDPLFTTPSAPLYKMEFGTSSPLKNASSTTKSSPSAYRFLTRDATPDIGAFEFGASGEGLPPPAILTIQ